MLPAPSLPIFWRRPLLPPALDYILDVGSDLIRLEPQPIGLHQERSDQSLEGRPAKTRDHRLENQRGLSEPVKLTYGLEHDAEAPRSPLRLLGVGAKQLLGPFGDKVGKFFISVLHTAHKVKRVAVPRMAALGNMASSSSAMAIAPVGVVNACHPREAAHQAYRVAGLIHTYDVGFCQDAAAAVV